MKKIPGYPRYSATVTGQIYSVRAKRFLRLTPFTKCGCRHGRYLQVSLCRDGSRKTFSVHRIILETFVGPCPAKMMCRHLDGDPTNNQLDNLCWRTAVQNQADRKQHGTATVVMGEQHGKAKLTERQVKKIRHLYAAVKYKYSHSRLAKMFNISQPHVCDIINRKKWAHI